MYELLKQDSFSLLPAVEVTVRNQFKLMKLQESDDTSISIVKSEHVHPCIRLTCVIKFSRWSFNLGWL